MDNRDAAIGNRLYPPITDPDYALARAMEGCLSSYDYIVSQPSVLGPEASKRWREIMAGPRVPLRDKPIPLMQPLGLLGSLWLVLKGRRVYTR